MYNSSGGLFWESALCVNCVNLSPVALTVKLSNETLHYPLCLPFICFYWCCVLVSKPTAPMLTPKVPSTISLFSRECWLPVMQLQSHFPPPALCYPAGQPQPHPLRLLSGSAWWGLMGTQQRAVLSPARSPLQSRTLPLCLSLSASSSLTSTAIGAKPRGRDQGIR